MLNISLEITGKPDADTKLQAKSVVAALHAMFGNDVLPVTVTITGHPAITDIRAPDGYPTTAPEQADDEDRTEPTAAEAFGATATSAAAAFGQHREVGPDGIIRPSVEPAPTADTVERDADGIPWDKRIHAETKTKTAKGIWTRRRNTPDHLFDDVMAELKRANTARTTAALAGTAPAAPVTGGAVPLPPTGTVPTTPAAPAPSPAPAAPAASSTVPAAPAPSGETITSFPAIMMKVTQLQSSGKLTADGLASLLAASGIQPNDTGKYSIIELNKNQALIPVFDALLTDHVG